LKPERDASGYRVYDSATAGDRVAQIRGLIDAGLPTAIIRDVLPCLNGPREIHLDPIDTDMHRRLIHERDRMTQRIACLTRNRDAIDTYLAALNPPVEPPDGRAGSPRVR
jgi:DNA-binding transcriptional MerR regulator